MIGLSLIQKLYIGTYLTAPAGAPEVVSAPVITGVPFSGGTLTATNGVWTNSPTSYARQWYKGGVAISGATTNSYIVPLGDEGADITFGVLPSNGIGPAAAESVSSAVAIGPTSFYYDFSTNATTQIDHDFTASDVDTAGNKLNITTYDFQYVSQGQAIRVYFSSTGTLPAPLQAGVPYCLKNTTAGVRIYRWNDDSHAASIAGFSDGEDIPALTEFMLDIPVVLTSTGSGTHTMTTNKLIQVCTDLSGNGAGYTENRYNAMFEVGTDAKGNYLMMEGHTGLSQTQIVGAFYGKGATAQGQGLTAGTKRAGKVAAGFVMAGSLSATPHMTAQRAILQSSNVNSGTGVFTVTGTNGHGMTTGTPIIYGAYGTGAFPTPVSGTPSYVRSVSTTTFTLHPTSADASANTNVITYSNTGSGLFYVVNTSGVIKSNRQIIFDINQSNNDHHFSPQTEMIGAVIDFTSNAYNMAIWFPGNASVNGNFQYQYNLPVTRLGTNWTVLKIKLFVPPGSVGWTALDTGVPMTTGEYWITKDPSSPGTYFRMHRSEANALANVGVSTSSATCIKFPNTAGATQGSGKGGTYLLDKTHLRTFSDSLTLSGNPQTLVNYDEDGIYTLLRDYTGNGTNRKLSSGKNSLTNLINDAVTNEASGTVAAGTTNSFIIVGDAAEYHVPGAARIREVFVTYGANLATTQAQMQMAVDALKLKYGL